MCSWRGLRCVLKVDSVLFLLWDLENTLTGPEQSMGWRSSLLTLSFVFVHRQVCVPFSSPFFFFSFLFCLVQITCNGFMTLHEPVLCWKLHMQTSTFGSTSHLKCPWAVLPGGQEGVHRETLPLALLVPDLQPISTRLWAWLPSSLSPPQSKGLIHVIFSY